MHQSACPTCGAPAIMNAKMSGPEYTYSPPSVARLQARIEAYESALRLIGEEMHDGFDGAMRAVDMMSRLIATVPATTEDPKR